MPLSRRSILGAFAALASLPALGQVKGKTQAMRIGIIGAGWLGGTVGRVWVRAGHEVLFSSRQCEPSQDDGQHVLTTTP